MKRLLWLFYLILLPIVFVTADPLELMAGSIQVVSPNGGEEWEAGSIQQITWSAPKEIINIRIEFSLDGGSTWNLLRTSVSSSTGYFSWKILDAVSAKCFIRVTDSSNETISDTSDKAFSIVPSNSKWINYTVSDGLASNDINAIAVEGNGTLWFGSRNNGVSRFDGTSWKTYNTSNSGIVSNDFLWIEPDLTGKLWFGSTWDGVSSFESTWTNYKNAMNIRAIVVDKNNVKWFGEYSNSLSSFDGTNWIRYNDSYAYGCETAMLDTDNSIWIGYRFGSGVSNYDRKTWKHYTTADGLVDNGVRAMAVDQNGVRWFGTAGGISSFDGQKWTSYPKNPNMPYNTVEAVAVDQNNVKWFGTYGGGGLSFDGVTWKQYNTQNSGICANDIIRVLVDKNNGVWFASRTNGISCYTNNNGPYIRVASPNGNEIWEAGSTHEMTWAYNEVSRLKIEYSTDAGLNWKLLADNVDASLRSYSWTTPQIQSFHCLARLTDTSNYKNYDVSNNEFIISPPLMKVTSPDGGEKWVAGTNHKITWVSIGARTVKIEYSTDGGRTWKTITESTDAASGSYPWTIPITESTTCQIQITDLNNQSLTDTGGGIFSIVLKPYITVTSPNGGEVWSAGSNNNITWGADGIDKVKVEYSVDGGLSWNSITQNALASLGFYTFNPPNIKSILCLVRVSDQLSATVSDQSDAVFTIVSIISSVGDNAPKEFTVFQNTPNPFNPKTSISFTIPQSGQVSLDIYNLSGQLVDTLLAGKINAGRHTISWNASRFSAGIYFCLVSTDKETKTIKMLLLK